MAVTVAVWPLATPALTAGAMGALPVLRDAIAYCESIKDFVSRDLFQYILESEEEQVDTLETQFEMIERMGIQNYVQLQSKAKED